MTDRRGRGLAALAFLVPLAHLGPGQVTSAFRLKSAILVAAAAALALSVARWMHRTRTLPVTFTRHGIAGALFFALQLASAAWAGNPLGALDVAIGRVALGAVFLLAYVHGERLPVRSVLGAAAAAAIGVALFAMGASGASSTLENPNFAATFLACALPGAALLFLDSPRSGAARALGAAACVVAAGQLLRTGSRGGWIAGAVGLAVLAAGTRQRRAILVPVALLAALAVVPGLRERARTSIDPSWPTNRVRLLVWGATARVVRDHPLLGVGAGGFESAFAPHRPAEEALLDAEGARVDQPHHLLLHVVVETGPIALAALAVVLGGVALSLRRATRPDDWALAGIVAAYLAHGLVEGVLDNAAAGLLFWFACGLLVARAPVRSRAVEIPGGRVLALATGLPALAALGLHAAGTWSDHLLAGAWLTPSERVRHRLELVHRASESAPWDPRVERERGYVERVLGHAHHERALRRDGDPERAMELARFHYSEATAAYERALDLDPNHEGAWDGLGLARWRSGDEVGALDAWDRALEIAPWSAELHRRRADALRGLKRWPDAAAETLAAFELSRSPGGRDALEVARACARAGQSGQAGAWLARAVEMGVPEDNQSFLEIQATIRMNDLRPND